jgi:hypothetical protein
MAQQFVTSAGTLIIPSAKVQYQVATANAGLATTGVLMIVGEADAGPRFSAEATLQDNSFGPDSLAAVISKYQSGPIVDAFRAATAPANDPNIVGSFSSCVIVKTNDSIKAKSALTIWGGGAYNSAGALAMSLADKSYGKLGNLIFYTIDQKTAEVVPTTGAFTMLLPIAATDISIRVNGGAALPLTLGALSTPAANVAAIDALAGVAATGGTDRVALPRSVAGNLALTVLSGNNVQIDYTGTWEHDSPVGDTLYIPATSC